jgi:PhnB protein
MAERRSPLALSAQFDAAVEAVMTNTPPPPLDPQLAPLLQLAADLRDLPRADFKARLKADLQRRGPAALRAKPIPEGYHTATPCLVLRDAAAAIDFYKRAFGATELMRFAQPSGQIMHAEIQLGDSRIAIAPEAPQWGNLSPQALRGSAVPIQLYVEDVDAFAERAVAAGAKVLIPVANQFYGDRAGRLADPFGHVWIVGTHKEDVSAEEMRRRAAAWAHEHRRPSEAPPVVPAATEELPASFHTVTPFLQVRNVGQTVEFLQEAFGAEVIVFDRGGDPPHDHADLRIGDSMIMMSEAISGYAPTTSAFYLSVPDVDAAYERALRAGAASQQAPKDMPWGHRMAHVKDALGNSWFIAAHKKEVR